MLTLTAFQALMVTIRLTSAASSPASKCSATAPPGLVGDVIIGLQGHRFGKGQRGPLALREVGRLPPRRQGVEPLLALPDRAGILGVHVDAVGAAVELRGAYADQLAQAGIEVDPVQLLGRGVVQVGEGAREVGGVVSKSRRTRDRLGCRVVVMV